MTQIRDEIITLTQRLIEIPSRGGLDPVEPIVTYLAEWFAQNRVPHNLLRGPNNEIVGLFVHLQRGPGPRICLNACLDTADWGDVSSWSHHPTAAVISDNMLYGRGAADSKAAVAVFALLAREFLADSHWHGSLYFVFDADEHTGNFEGIKAFLRAASNRPDAVIVGYPGNDTLKVGARGFLRADVSVVGIAAHSGSKSNKGTNAIERATRLISRMADTALPLEGDPHFPFGPKFTTTAIQGGSGYSSVPDRCDFSIDIRLTPSFDEDAAKDWCSHAIRDFTTAYPSTLPIEFAWRESWPAYRIPLDAPLVQRFVSVAGSVFNKRIVPIVVGPSNIGNYLARYGIPTVNGFGVTYDNIHAANERIDVLSIEPVYTTYQELLPNLLHETAPLGTVIGAAVPASHGTQV